jgi:DNA-binding XRE family transcriptional regulator
MAKGYSTIPAKHRSQVRRELENFMNGFKRRRVELDLTQEAMAEGTGVSIETIRNIEQHRRVPSLPLLFHLARYLKLKLSSSKDS